MSVFVIRFASKGRNEQATWRHVRCGGVLTNAGAHSCLGTDAALDGARSAHFHHDEMARVDVDRRDLDRAYEYCDALTALHSRSFYVASSLLPKEKRSAVRALYAFCRVTDDIVDSGQANAASELAAWQARTAAAWPSHDDLVALAWADARARFSVPQRYAEHWLQALQIS